MFDLIAGVLAWIYSVVNNLGFAIILLTLVVMIVMTPLTLSGTKSMIKMQRLQPELRKIQQKHKGDREKMNAEMMAFYQENNVNPVGGCLPLFFQLPVFLVLYRVLQGLTRREVSLGIPVGSSSWVGSGSTNQVPSIQDLGIVRAFNPQYLSDTSDLAKDLHNETDIPFFFNVFDLSQSPLDALKDSIISGLPYLVLLLVVLVTSLYQQRQIQGRNPNAMANPQQAALMKVMPFFLPVIAFSLQSALLLYFITSNLYRIGQQSYITRALYAADGDTVVEARVVDDEPPAKKPKNKGGSGASGGGASKSTPAKATPAKATPKKPQKTKPASDRSDNNSGSDTGRSRRGAGAGRAVPRDNPAPSSRTGGTQPRSSKNRKKKRK